MDWPPFRTQGERKVSFPDESFPDSPLHDGRKDRVPLERMGIPHLPWFRIVRKMREVAVLVHAAVGLVGLDDLRRGGIKAEKAAEYALVRLEVR